MAPPATSARAFVSRNREIFLPPRDWKRLISKQGKLAGGPMISAARRRGGSQDIIVVFTTFSRMRRRFRVIRPAVFGSLPSRPEDLARWMEVMRRGDRHHSPLGYGAWPRHLIHSIINHEYTAMRSCCPTVAGPSGIPRNEETTASTPEPRQILEC